MTHVKEEKKKSKVKIERYNPTSRKNSKIEIEEMQIGVLKYSDISDNFECLVGIETENMEADWLTEKDSSFNRPRRISRIQWDVSWGDTKVGSRVILSPRDIAILDAVLTYLKKKGFYIP